LTPPPKDDKHLIPSLLSTIEQLISTIEDLSVWQDNVNTILEGKPSKSISSLIQDVSDLKLLNKDVTTRVYNLTKVIDKIQRDIKNDLKDTQDGVSLNSSTHALTVFRIEVLEKELKAIQHELGIIKQPVERISTMLKLADPKVFIPAFTSIVLLLTDLITRLVDFKTILSKLIGLF
jgi:hypothetical protein